MIQKAAAMGDWWLAASSRQCACSCITSPQSFLAKHQVVQVTQPPYSPDLVPCDFWLFPKLQSPLKGKRFQSNDEIQENMMGQLMMIRRTVWGLRVPSLKGAEVSLSYVFFVSFIYFNKCLFFIVHGWILSGQTSYVQGCSRKHYT